MILKVLISTRSFAEYDKAPLQLLESRGFEVVLNSTGRKLKPEETIELAKDCEAIIAGTEQYSEEVFEKLPKLKYLVRCGIGMDGIDLEAAKKHNVTITNTPEGPTGAVAELTVAFIIDSLRQINFMDRQLHGGAWTKKMGRMLSGKTIGIVGLGRIGRRVAELLKPFNVKIIAAEPNPDKNWAGENQVSIVSLEELLRESDIVTLHIPYTEQNSNLINDKMLGIMKEGSILVNASRGGLVDESALYDALKSGHLGGAALDTMEKEPYDGPLKELDNVILTPHIGSYALEARIEMETKSAENLIKLTEGKK